MVAEIRSHWIDSLLSTEPADRSRAEAAVLDVYAAAGLPAPRYFFWFDDPFAAAWAYNLLLAPHDSLMQQITGALAKRKPEREMLERIRAALSEQARTPWESFNGTAGQSLRFRGVNKLLWVPALRARRALYDEDPVVYGSPEAGELTRIEKSFREVQSGQANGDCYVNTSIQCSDSYDYSFAQIALDQERGAGRDVPPLLAACWQVADNCGLWWPFERAAVFCERPEKMLLTEDQTLHCEDGPAMTYRNGRKFYAWHGTPMCEEWILHPEEIDKTTLECFDEAFQQRAKSLKAKLQPKRMSKVKASPLLKGRLPVLPADREKYLRKHNKGKLPYYDRYMAGEIKVWDELIVLGKEVRSDPYAADALAVAYEIMERVRQNVVTVTARLQAFGFEANERLHTPPDPDTYRGIERLEKATGLLPLALRAFYEIVGGVDWTGHHPSIAPRGEAIPVDPLVVFPVELALQAAGGDEDGIIIAPDEIFKAGDAGGDCYQIEPGEGGADSKLVNERHNLYFVDYLRLVFRFGGFPGYEGVEVPPPELSELSSGLAAF